jgi:hypothetical protein
MALEPIILVRGKVGDFVSCLRGGKYYLRSLPEYVTQTAASQVSSNRFGNAATIGARFRHCLAPALLFPKDKPMQNRFQGAIAKWFKKSNEPDTSPTTAISDIRSFLFNQCYSVADRWQVNFTFTQPSANEIELHIPEFAPAVSIDAPIRTSSIKCTIAAACMRLSDAEAIGHDHFSMVINHDQTMIPEQSKLLSVATEKGCLVIVAAAMTYQLSNGESDKRPAFMPNSVIGAWYID